MRFFVSLALVCFVSSALAETPVPVRPGDKELAVLVQRWVAFFDKVVDAVVADKDDCAKMATAVNGLIDANAALLAQAVTLKGKSLPKDAEAHMLASAQKMAAALMQKCETDRGVQAAFQRLSAAPTGK